MKIEQLHPLFNIYKLNLFILILSNAILLNGCNHNSRKKELKEIKIDTIYQIPSRLINIDNSYNKAIDNDSLKNPDVNTSNNNAIPQILNKNLNFRCNSNMMIYNGALQSLKKQQHSEIYRFCKCFDSTNTFELINVIDEPYEKRAKISDVYNAFRSFPDSVVLNGFVTYAFSLPLSPAPDPGDDPYNFPCKVDVYVLKPDKVLKHLGNYYIKKWEDYVQLQYKTIFHLLKTSN